MNRFARLSTVLVMTCLLVLAGLTVLYFNGSEFLMIDQCLDDGGCWNAVEGLCEDDDQNRCQE